MEAAEHMHHWRLVAYMEAPGVNVWTCAVCGRSMSGTLSEPGPGVRNEQ